MKFFHLDTVYNKKLNSWKISSNKLTKKLNYCYIVNSVLDNWNVYFANNDIIMPQKLEKKKEKTIITNGMILIFNFIIYFIILFHHFLVNMFLMKLKYIYILNNFN